MSVVISYSSDRKFTQMNPQTLRKYLRSEHTRLPDSALEYIPSVAHTSGTQACIYKKSRTNTGIKMYIYIIRPVIVFGFLNAFMRVGEKSQQEKGQRNRVMPSLCSSGNAWWLCWTEKFSSVRERRRMRDRERAPPRSLAENGL